MMKIRTEVNKKKKVTSDLNMKEGARSKEYKGNGTSVPDGRRGNNSSLQK